MKRFEAKKIRNVAIIAHIDHGKTTLLDNLLKQSHTFASHEIIPERVMDSYDQERERGITIFAKQTSLFYHDYKINVIDTPGHSDFSGEVERVLGMVNSVLLLVDATEGPMPQTRFLLLKALKMGLKPIVVLNKIDRPYANSEKTLNATFDLFVELGASDEQLDFAYCYASGINGYAKLHLEDQSTTLDPLFELIIQKVPAPSGDAEKPFLMQAASLMYDPYLGRQVHGRILEGKIAKKDVVERVNRDRNSKKFTIEKIEGFFGLKKVEMDEAEVGDIVIVSGIDEVTIGDTIRAVDSSVVLPPIHIQEPALSIDFLVNSGPFAGKEGKHVTMNKIRERLHREKLANVTLRIEEPKGTVEKITVSGRGELHLAVLMETLRRENFEFLVSKPEVILKKRDGVVEEPMELVHIEVPETYLGAVMEEMGRRKAELRHLHTNEQKISQLDFLVPTRGLMGCSSELMTLTKGLAVATSIFDHYAPHKGEMPHRKRGVLVSMCTGVTNSYACFNLQKRAQLFVKPGDPVYEGMIVGENSREQDLFVNVTKAKHLTNVRAAGKDENIILTPPKTFTLEDAIGYIDNDEYVEITPLSIRLRKRFLTDATRKKSEEELF